MTDKIMRQFSRIVLTAGAAIVLTATPVCSSEVFGYGGNFGALTEAREIEDKADRKIDCNLLEREQAGWKLESTEPAEENAAWVSGLESHLACANTVFAIAGEPFMHKIRVPQSASQSDHAVVPVKTGIQRVWNLPEGLTWNESRCLVQGTAPAAGDYVYSVEFTSDGQKYKEGIKLHVAASKDELISPTPMMGWQSWNVMEENVSHDAVMAQAQQLKDKGFLAAGYNYVGIDDYWQKSGSNSTGRNQSDGSPLWDTSKFPDGMSYTATALHNLGFKAGIYSDCGTLTCAGMYGSYGYETIDANAYASWGYDMLKEDWFWSGHGVPNGYSPLGNNRQAYELYKRMGDALKNTGRRFMLYMCEWGTHEPWRWAPEAGASCWRMSYDARDAWWGKTSSGQNKDVNDNGVGLHNTIVLMRNLWPYVGINRYNDADMLCVGIRGNGGSTNDCIMEKRQDNAQCDTEYETNFAMWCMWSSPLLLTLDMTKTINSHDQALLLNSELIAINQDPLGQGAELVKSDDKLDYYMKDLANGDVAIAVVNLGDNTASYRISLGDYEALSKTGSYTARNLLAKSDAGTLSSGTPITGSLPAHGTFIIRLSKN